MDLFKYVVVADVCLTSFVFARSSHFGQMWVLCIPPSMKPLDMYSRVF